MPSSTDVHYNTCSNISRRGISCGNGTCPNGTQCCQQPGSNHVTCCAPGSCNGKRGHCSKPRVSDCPTRVEGYEGPYGNCHNSSHCKKWKLVAFIALFVAFISCIGFVAKSRSMM